jgi:sialate O-acetylesterase
MPPVIEEVTPVDGALHLKFDNQVGAVDDGSGMKGFAISGEDKSYQMAEANYLVIGKDDKGRPKEDKSVIVLSSPLVNNPVHFRYAWARNPMANIQLPRNSDVPLATQRSDDWDILEGPVSTEGMNERQAKNAMRRAMQETDLKRRLHEAKELIQSQE